MPAPRMMMGLGLDGSIMRVYRAPETSRGHRQKSGDIRDVWMSPFRSLGLRLPVWDG